MGCNYGRTVLIPAFRHDSRCEVVGLAGTDADRTAELARTVNVARGVGDWHLLVEDPAIKIVAIAVPPDLQPTIAQRALELGKPVFLEKPLAADLTGAQMILDSARKSERPTIIDFNFPELPSWRHARLTRVRFRGPLGVSRQLPRWEVLRHERGEDQRTLSRS